MRSQSHSSSNLKSIVYVKFSHLFLTVRHHSFQPTQHCVKRSLRLTFPALKAKHVRLFHYLLAYLLPINPAVVITGTNLGTATAIAPAYGKPKAMFLTGRNTSKTTLVIKEI